MQVIDTIKQTIRKMNKKSRIVITVLAVLLLAGMSFGVYAKYYKTSYNQGIAIASGFYFSSNYMAALELDSESAKRIDSIEDLIDETAILNQVYTKASDERWNNTSNGGAQSSIILNIDNYTNQLLYNDIDLDVTYAVEFILLDIPENVSYQVRKGTGTESFQELTKETKVTFTGTLKGGKLSWDDYQLQITISDLNQYTTARVLALAYPTAPSYIQNTKKLAGIITADYQESEINITDQGFLIGNELDESADWKKVVESKSALVYQIRTTGNYFGDGQNGQRQKIRLTWNPAMYELNKYDKYRREIEEKYGNNADTLKEYLNEDEGFMIVEILPYSSIQFVFYKKEDFDVELKSQQLGDFKKTVEAEKIDD